MECWHCARAIDVHERVGFRDYCPQCDRPLHACRNCELYDPAFNNQCREPMADRVVDKERANFCEYFAPTTSARTAAGASSKAATKLEELFRKKS